MFIMDNRSSNPIEEARTADLPGAGLAVSYKRFSSKQQEGGDSIRRQGDQAAQWAGVNGFEIIDVELADRGKSAFKGANAREGGALFEFMQMLKDGRLPQGVTLVAENPDRISRQHQQDGKDLLRKVVEAGANVALLSGVFLTAGRKIDAMDDVRLTLEFDRAHQESKYKSYRIGQAWKKNTADVAEGKRLRSGITPSWLRIEGEVKGDKVGKFKKITEKVKVVQEVFRRFANGERVTTIARDFDRRGVPPLRRGRWVGNNISQLVRSEAPYGTLEVGRMVTEDERSGKVKINPPHYRKGDRVILEVHKGYFPRIVDEETEARVRFHLSNRVRAEGGSDPRNRASIQPQRYITKAMLTGVVRDHDGARVKRKAYARTSAYVNAITGKYIAAVSHVDQVLIDYWPEVRMAASVQVDPEEGGLEEQLIDARETLDFLRSKPSTKPRVLLAAEAEVEELEQEVRLRNQAKGVAPAELPRSIEDLEPHDVNALVRRVIAKVIIHKSGLIEYETIEVTRPDGVVYERRKPVPQYDLEVTMRNGVRLTLGQGASGLKVETSG